MPRYIDADALKKDLEENYVFVGFADLLNDIIDAIEAQPTADVVERKRGKWKNTRPDAPMFGFYYCSLCGRKQTSPQDHFCPNCGADMKGEDDGLD